MEPHAYWWIDAICIDQTDVSEKSSQVAMMRDIFSSAESVLAWLGPEQDGSSTALELIRTVSHGVIDHQNDADWLEWYVKDYGIPPGQESPGLWETCKALWERPYWRRIWCVQEMVLAQNLYLMCGHDTIYWQAIIAVTIWATHIKSIKYRPQYMSEDTWRKLEVTKTWFWPSGPVEKIEGIRAAARSRLSGEQSYDLSPGILASASSFEATDPRDKVYGLLGLMDIDIKPDYSKITNDVLLEAGLKYFEASGLLQSFALAGLADSEEPKLPSWLPDFSHIPRQGWHYPASIFDEPETSSKCHRVIDGAWPALVVRGKFLHTVHHVEGCVIEEHENDWVRALFLFNSYCQDRGPRYVTGETMLSSILRLLLQDRDVLNNNQQVVIPSEEFFVLVGCFLAALCIFDLRKDVERHVSGAATLAKLGLPYVAEFSLAFSRLFLGVDTPSAPWDTAWEALSKHSGGMSATVFNEIFRGYLGNFMFCTQDGYIGYGPRSVQPMDLVYDIDGCACPIILRRVQSHFVLVGTCYIQGLMQGELLKEHDDPVTLERIEIR